MNFWCQVGSFSTSGGGPEHLGRVLGDPGEALGRPWVPKDDFEAIWEAPPGAPWLENVKKLMRILTISVKMSLSPTRELNFEAWGSPR